MIVCAHARKRFFSFAKQEEKQSTEDGQAAASSPGSAAAEARGDAAAARDNVTAMVEMAMDTSAEAQGAAAAEVEATEAEAVAAEAAAAHALANAAAALAVADAAGAGAAPPTAMAVEDSASGQCEPWVQAGTEGRKTHWRVFVLFDVSSVPCLPYLDLSTVLTVNERVSLSLPRNGNKRTATNKTSSLRRGSGGRPGLVALPLSPTRPGTGASTRTSTRISRASTGTGTGSNSGTCRSTSTSTSTSTRQHLCCCNTRGGSTVAGTSTGTRSRPGQRRDGRGRRRGRPGPRRGGV